MGRIVPAVSALALALALILCGCPATASDARNPDVSWLRPGKAENRDPHRAEALYASGRFRPVDANAIVPAFPEDAIWLRIPAGTGNRYLCIDSRGPVRFSILDARSPNRRSGTPAAASRLPGGGMVIPLPDQDTNGAMYVEITVPQPTHLGIRLASTLDQAVRTFFRHCALSGMFLAGILVFAAINLLFGFSLKQANLFWYAGLLAAFLLDVMTNSGMLGVMTGLDPSAAMSGRILLQAVFLAMAGGFTRSFLMTRRYAPRADKVLISYSLGALVFGATVQWLGKPHAGILMLPLVLALPILTTAIGVICLRRGFTPAKFFILGWLLFFAGPIAILLSHAGLGKFLFWPPAAFMAGSAMQMFVFMLAVLDRVKVLREERFQLEKAAVRVNSALATQRRLFRDISHELRSPLSRLWLALEMIRRKAGPKAEIDINQATRDIIRIRELQDQISTLAKLQSGEPWRMEDVRLDSLVKDVAGAIEYEAEVAGLELSLEADWPCTVRASRELMSRAVENVLRNAIRYSLGKGPVEIRLGPDAGGRAARLVIRDHGPGVPDKALARLFDPYYTVDTPESSGGLGLGLAIVRHAVRLHGGGLKAANADGGGLAVAITIPLQQTGR